MHTWIVHYIGYNNSDTTTKPLYRGLYSEEWKIWTQPEMHFLLQSRNEIRNFLQLCNLRIQRALDIKKGDRAYMAASHTHYINLFNFYSKCLPMSSCEATRGWVFAQEHIGGSVTVGIDSWCLTPSLIHCPITTHTNNNYKKYKT